MKSLVVYFSRGGKTKRVADAIANELGCKAIDIKNELPQSIDVDLLVVGSGNYGGKPHDSIQKFLDSLQAGNGSKAAIFTTSGGPNPRCLPLMQKALESKEYTVASYFACRGQFLFFNRGHPDDGDLESAREFASALRNGIK